MSGAEIKEKVSKIIVDKLGVEASEVTENASFTNDLGADSLDIVERSRRGLTVGHEKQVRARANRVGYRKHLITEEEQRLLAERRRST